MFANDIHKIQYIVVLVALARLSRFIHVYSRSHDSGVIHTIHAFTITSIAALLTLAACFCIVYLDCR
jgi:hypothetical protein